MTPFVSCLCPTYGRFPQFGFLLDECVESFSRQDYPAERRELIILNDCAAQTILCSTRGVVVVNLQRRFRTLGEKYNACVGLAKGDLLLPWEDDDISLPKRISQAVGKIGTAHAWNPQRTWFLNGDELTHGHSHGICHNASIFSRDAFVKVGGYPATNGNQDAIMDSRLKAIGPLPAPLTADPQDWQFIYCWGRSDRHLSGAADMEDAYRTWGQLEFVPGVFPIAPKWHRDYISLTRMVP